MWLVNSCGVVCTRIDLAIDDSTFELIPFDKMVSACREKDYTGFRKSKLIDGDLSSTQGFGERTLYLGSRLSTEMTRIYNHKNKFLRLEKEYKGEKATLAVDKLLQSSDYKEFAQLVANLAIGSVHFLDRNNDDGSYEDHNVSRCKTLPWWQDFLELIGGSFKLSLERKKFSLQATKDWLSRQVSRTLLAARLAYGDKRFLKFIGALSGHLRGDDIKVQLLKSAFAAM
jgi:hypothetical protein